jgi:hypothetical protein
MAAIVSALRLSRATYFEWKRLYLAGGVDGLKVRPIPGANLDHSPGGLAASGGQPW